METMMASGPTNRKTGLPGWVKVFAWAGAATVLVVGVMVASGHGPWQHMSGMH